jgi:AraC-like DNA-binding protein
MRAVLSSSARRTELRSLRFELDVPSGVLPDVATWPRARVLTRDPLTQALVAHVFELLGVGSPTHAALAKNGLRHLLAVFLAAGEETLDPLGLPIPVEKALSYTKKLWEQNALRSPSLEQLAAAAGVSTGHLTRLFRGSLGVAPLRALRRLRLERAATELVTSRRTIKEIAYQAGFGSQFHFSRCFKKSFGRTPSAFRGEPTPLSA